MAYNLPESQSNHYPLARVIGNNDPPTREERQLASQMLEQIDIGLNGLQDEITALRATLSQLQSRHTALKERRDGQIAPILSPWRKLPPEILSIIFQFAVNPGWSSTFSPTTDSTNRSHFRDLRAVCRMWREVAFSTRSLWTNVWIDFDSEVRVADALLDVKGYLERAGPSLPLELGFNWSRFQLISNPWLDYVFSQRSRLTTVAFHTYGALFRDLEERLKGPTGAGWATRHLTVELDGSVPMHTPTPSNPNIMNTCFPVLETLHFGFTLGNEFETILLNGHSGLIKLHLRMIPVRPDVYFSKLGRFSNLEELTLIMNAFIPLSDNAPTCSLPRLRNLTIRNACSFTLFTKIQTPSLRSLYVNTAFPPRTRPFDVKTIQARLWGTFPHIVSFLRNAESNIEEFYLRCGFLRDNNALRDLLESLPSVQRLCLDTWFTDGPVSGPGIPSTPSNEAQQAGDPETQASPESASILPQLCKICLHSPDQNPHPNVAPATRPFVRSPAYWRSFLAFLRSRNESHSQTPGEASTLWQSGIGGAGPSMEGFEHGIGSTSGMGGISRPNSNLIVCLPDLESLLGVLDETQLQAFESVDELDGVSITVETARSCDFGR